MSCRSCHLCVWRLLLAMLLALMVISTVQACPFCSVESRTLTEEIQSSDAVVLAKFVAEAPKQDNSDTSGSATFEIEEVLRGDDRVKPRQQIQVVYFGENDRGKTFFISGIGVENNQLEWTTPLPLSPAAVEYVRQLQALPAGGADRIAFFQEYFEHDDPLLAQDAYDEFARAPYADLKALQDRMQHDKLIEWINSPDVGPSRRRLYLTMLGVCGSEADLPMLEKMIASDYSAIRPVAAHLAGTGLALGGPIALPAWIEQINLDERRKKIGLDAMIAAYLMLDHGAGMDLIERRFLANPNAEYAHVYSTIMALRTLGEETDAVPRDRLLESMRLLLDNQDFAEQVILDIARWEDWSVLDRLVAMYKAGNERSYVRPPIVTYLTVASEQPGDVGERGKAALAELTALDPKGVKQAESLAAFGFLARARGDKTGTGAQRPADAEDDKNTAGAPADTGEFAATAEEMADAEAAEPEDFEDPSSYAENPGTRPDEIADEEEVDVVEEDSLEAADGEPTAGEKVEDLAAAATSTTAATPAPPVAVYNRSLVIGVPLAAAGVLAVVYWLILRWGAV